MSTAEETQVGLPFYLYNYDHWGAAGEVHELIEAGCLPPDTFFRLAYVGQQTDPTYERGSKSLNYTLMLDMVQNVNRRRSMRPETRQLLEGDLPNAVVDVNSNYNYPSYAMLEPMYYRMADLASAIQRRRETCGQTIPEAPFDRRLHTVQDERARCLGIARPLWRLIVKRFHPEWLENPSQYYPARYIGPFAVVYSIGENRMRRGIVSHAVISDPLVMSIYQEATETGVKGIGRVGKEDLRLLLSDEHPELH
jgi:hypothetical protein